MNDKRIRIIIAAALIVGVATRISQFAGKQSVPPTQKLNRERIANLISAGASDSADAVKLKRFRFSSGAEIVLGVGSDGQPGRAGVDDNINGLVDDRNEMGAVGSDDVCLSPADEGYESVLADPNTLVISRGGFEPCENDQAADRYQVQGLGWFIPDVLPKGG